MTASMVNVQILLVDDNPIQGATRCAILARTGAAVLVAQRPEEALLLLDRPDVRSSLRAVVTDHCMPGMNGPELVRSIRALFPTLPIIVLSGLPEAEPEYDAYDVAFRSKPFPPEELISLVRTMIAAPVLRSA